MNESKISTNATIKCPKCGNEQQVKMPINSCQHFYEYLDCGEMLKPKK